MLSYDASNFNFSSSKELRELQHCLRVFCRENDIESDEDFMYIYGKGENDWYVTNLYCALQEIKECYDEALYDEHLASSQN